MFEGVSGVIDVFCWLVRYGKERTKLGFRCWGLVTEIDYSVEIIKIFQTNYWAMKRGCRRLSIVC